MPANFGETDQLRRDKNAILNREQHRRAIQLSQQNIDEMSNINKIQGYRQFYDVSEANAENLKIAQMLETPDEVHFPKEDKADLLIAGRRNLNFIFANMEKMGGDSELMHNIKTNLYDYENLLAMNVVQTHEDNLRDMLNATIAKSQTVIDFCNTYIQRGRSMFIWRWGRFDAVRKLKERTEEEQKILTSLSNSQQIELIREHLTGKERVSDLLNTLRYEGKIKKKLMAERRTRNTNLRSASTQAEDRIKTKEQEVSDQILKDLKAEIGNEKEIKLNKSDVEAVSAMVGLNKLALKDAAKFYKILNKNVDFDLRPDSIHLRKDINEKLGLSRDPVGGQEPPVTEEEQRKYDEELEKNKQEKQEKIECMEQMFDVIQSFDMKQLNIDKLEDLFSEKYDQVIMLRKLCLAAEGMLPSYAHEFNYEDSEIPQKYNREQQAKLKTRIECVKNASVLYMNTQKILKSTAADTVDLDACFTKGRNYIEKAIQKEEDTEKEHVYRLMLETFVKLYSPDLEKAAYGPGIDIEALLDNEIENMRMEMLEGDLGNFNEPKKIKKKQEEIKTEENKKEEINPRQTEKEQQLNRQREE